MPMDVQQDVFLVRVWPGGPVNNAGLQTNDIIVRIDKTPITSSSQVYDMVQKGRPLSVEVVRGRQKLKIIVTPEPTI